MILANELRLGNYINYKGEAIKITMIGEYGVQSKNKDVIINAKFSTPDLSPIPLTEKKLLNCGFVKHKAYRAGGQDEWSGMLAWSIPSNRLFSNWLFRGNASCLHLVGYINTQIEYLHQLQNLYYELTGEELNIQL